MSQVPPDEPPSRPVSPPSLEQPLGSTARSAARPAMVTAAAIILFVVGGLYALLGILVIAGGSALGGDSGGAAVLFGFLYAAIGAVAIYAGVQILGLRDRGRVIGLVVGGVGALLALISLFTGVILAIIFLAAFGFVIYVLVTHVRYFSKP